MMALRSFLRLSTCIKENHRPVISPGIPVQTGTVMRSLLAYKICMDSEENIKQKH